MKHFIALIKVSQCSWAAPRQPMCTKTSRDAMNHHLAAVCVEVDGIDWGRRRARDTVDEVMLWKVAGTVVIKNVDHLRR